MAERAIPPHNQIVVQQRDPTSASLSCPKITSTNYYSWVILMEAMLDAQGLWEAVDPVTGDAVDGRKNKFARVLILQALPENILMQVAKSRQAREIWESPRVRFLGADQVQQARLQSLKKDLDNLKTKDTQTVEEFVEKLSEYVNKFNSLGQDLEDSVVFKRLLDAMPPRFIAIVATMEQIADLNIMTFEDCVGRLKAFEKRIKGHEAQVEKDSKLLSAKEESSDHNGSEQSHRNQGRGRGSSNQNFRGRGRGPGRGFKI